MEDRQRQHTLLPTSHPVCTGANLTELSTLDLSGNSFSGTLPPGLLRPSLTHLNLANNLLSGASCSSRVVC